MDWRAPLTLRDEVPNLAREEKVRASDRGGVAQHAVDVPVFRIDQPQTNARASQSAFHACLTAIYDCFSENER